MNLKIPKKYLKAQDDNYLTHVYIISAPENVEELNGYIMKIPQEDVTVTDSSLILRQGNEWNKKQKEYSYMFEKESKILHHPSKRYRYSEKELIILYKSANSLTFKKRIENIEHGSGKLVKASYTAYSKLKGKYKTKGWFIAPDADQKWVYSLDYDVVRNYGKHSKNAKGFSIIEEYYLPDISVIYKNKDKLEQLFYNLESIYNKHGEKICATSLAEEIVSIAYNRISSEICTEIIDYQSCETIEGERIREELLKLSTEMENKVNNLISNYQAERLAKIIDEIKNLTGIEIKHTL